MKGPIYFIVAIYMLLSTMAHSNTVDSLESVLKAENSAEGKIEIARELYMNFIMVDPSTAKTYARQIIEIAEPSTFNKGIATGYMYLGIANQYEGEFSEAIGNLKEAVKYNELAENIQGQMSCYGNLGNVYLSIGDLESAAGYLLKALGVAEELKDSVGISNSLNNIGALYKNMGNVPEAMNYFIRSMEIDKEMGNEFGAAQALTNVANMLQLSGKLDSAWTMYMDALIVYRRENHVMGISDILTEIGLVYFRKGNVDSAIAVTKRSNEIKAAAHDNYGIAYNLLNLADMYRRMKEYQLALTASDQASVIAKEIDANSLLETIELGYSEIYEGLGEYERSLIYYKKYTARKDSLFNEDKSKDIGKLEAKYEFEKEEHERETAEQEKLAALQAVESRRNNLQYSGILIFLVFIFAAIFVVGRFTIPISLAEGLVFFAFLLFFEFTLVLLDPYIEEYSSGAPAIKLAFNAILAAMIFPLHSFFEGKMKSRLMKE